MSSSLKWEGLEELKQAMRTLPEDLTGEASNIVEGSVNAAQADVLAGYANHRRSGRLMRGVTVSHFDRGRFVLVAVLKSAAKHAALFENGTQARHTAIGANRGSMPPGHVFWSAVRRRQRVMFEQLKSMLVRYGLIVTGEAA